MRNDTQRNCISDRIICPIGDPRGVHQGAQRQTISMTELSIQRNAEGRYIARRNTNTGINNGL